MKKNIQVMAALFLVVLALSACSPTVAPADQSELIQNTPTVDTQSQIILAVAQTIEVQNQISTAVALTTVAQYTPTPAPTATAETIPTATLVVLPTPTAKVSSGGSAPVAGNYACDVIHVRPGAGTELNRGQNFDIKMTVVNQGNRPWPAGYDFKYSGGSVMTNVTWVELPEMLPGAQYEIVLDAVAPSEYGTHTMTWKVEGNLCFGYVTIVVK